MATAIVGHTNVILDRSLGRRAGKLDNSLDRRAGKLTELAF